MKLAILILWASLAVAGEKVHIEPSPIAIGSHVVLPLSALLTAYDVASMMDLSQSLKVTRDGHFVEGNPILSGIVRDPMTFIVVKIAGALLVNLAVKIVYNQSPAFAYAIAAVLVVVQGYVVLHNRQVMR